MRYFFGGFLIGSGIVFIKRQIELDRQTKIWEEATNGVQKPVEPAS